MKIKICFNCYMKCYISIWCIIFNTSENPLKMFAHVANVPTIYIHNIQVESETVGLAASDNTRLPLAVRLRLGVFYEQLQSCGLSFYINKVCHVIYKCIFILPGFNIF